MGTNTFSDAVAERVTAAITAVGETQLGVSEKTGIPRSTLMRRLSGVTPFNTDELDAIARALGVDLACLVSDSRAATFEQASEGVA